MLFLIKICYDKLIILSTFHSKISENKSHSKQ